MNPGGGGGCPAAGGSGCPAARGGGGPKGIGGCCPAAGGGDGLEGIDGGAGDGGGGSFRFLFSRVAIVGTARGAGTGGSAQEARERAGRSAPAEDFLR